MSRPALSDHCFADLRSIVYTLTGVTIDESKRSLLSGRVQRRLRALNVGSTKEYIALLKSLDSDAPEVSLFKEAVTTHKTSFFRTDSIWRYLASEVDGRVDCRAPLRCWSAACSTGEEPYSLAMLLRAARGPAGGMHPWAIQATDVSPPTAESACLGVYSKERADAAQLLRPDLVVKGTFVPCQAGLQINEEIRSSIKFGTHNLLDSYPGQFDIILLRNVLIYFSEEDEDRVVANILDALRPNGVLVIGESESLLAKGVSLTYEAPCVYRKKSS